MTEKIELDILGTKWTVIVGELARSTAGAKLFGLMDAEAREITINHDTHPTWHLYRPVEALLLA